MVSLKVSYSGIKTKKCVNKKRRNERMGEEQTRKWRKKDAGKCKRAEV